MLKDITLGQYFPGTTVIHRLDPRIKTVITLIFIVALFVADGYITYAIVAVFLIAGVVMSRLGGKTLLRSMKPVIWIILITAVLNLFYTPGEPIFDWWIFSISAEGIVSAVFMALRIVMLISGTFLLTYTTSPIMLTGAMEELLKPLKKLRVPVHELAMMMSIALRFIPTLIEETDKIISAQKARGADFETGNLLRRAKALVPILIPLFISAFRRADELAVAMECRCYSGGEGRTRLNRLKMNRTDVVFLLASFVFLALVIFLKSAGF